MAAQSPARRREPLSNVHNAPTTYSSPPPLSPWQNLDSSEKAPSSHTSGDEDVFIFPAPPAPEPVARTGLSIEITTITGVTAVAISSTPSRENVVPTEVIQTPPPIISRQSLLRTDDVAVPTATLAGEATEHPPPALAPLQPTYPPPERTPTPSGLPSYEASQRAAETRVARRLIYRHMGIENSSGVLGSRRGRRRAGNTAGPRDAPVWRPPVSQHAFGSHPFMQDLQLHGATRGGGFGAETETAAREGRSARPVQLEDYYFLRALESGGRENHSAAACDWTPCWAWKCGCLPQRRHPSDDVDLS